MNSPDQAVSVLRILPTFSGLVLTLFVTLVFPLAVSAAEEEATLQWVRTVTLSTPVNGIIAEVKVNRGDRVRADQVLLRLVDKTFRAEVVAGKARLRQAENNRDEARRELERTQELYDRTLLSDHDLQLAKIEKDAAEAALLSAGASLAQAEHDDHYSAIRAPFAAWVLQRNAQPGQTVVSSLQATPLIVLAEAGRMMARALVSGTAAAKINRGDKAGVTVAGKHYAGEVSFVALQPEKTGSDRYAVDIIFATNGQILRVGQAARVKF